MSWHSRDDIKEMHHSTLQLKVNYEFAMKTPPGWEGDVFILLLT